VSRKWNHPTSFPHSPSPAVYQKPHLFLTPRQSIIHKRRNFVFRYENPAHAFSPFRLLSLLQLLAARAFLVYQRPASALYPFSFLIPSSPRHGLFFPNRLFFARNPVSSFARLSSDVLIGLWFLCIPFQVVSLDRSLFFLAPFFLQILWMVASQRRENLPSLPSVLWFPLSF